MRKFSNWENVKAAAERPVLPKGGYKKEKEKDSALAQMSEDELEALKARLRR